MEKNLSRDELLYSLLKKAEDPFTKLEQKRDILRILKESSTMRGMNHLFLVDCYFKEENAIFNINKEEAIKQAKLALKENNVGSFYFLYLLLKDTDKRKARCYLLLSAMYGNPKAHLSLGDHYLNGTLFKKDLSKAEIHYQIAADCDEKDGYFKLLYLASLSKDIEKQKVIYEKAKLKNIFLPGVVK